MAGRSYKTEAVVLRSFRFGEADRVLHLYTRERGRIGAVAKGVRKTKSRFGGRLEPLSHVELMLHQGGGELQTVTGAELVRSHREAREDSYRLGAGLVGAEAMLRLFPEQEANALVLSFQLKLLWLSGYLPHVTSCADCGAETGLAGYSPTAGGAVCEACANGALPLSRDGLLGIEGLLQRPLAEASDAGLTDRGAREALGVITASYEYHGGFRLRTLTA